MAKQYRGCKDLVYALLTADTEAELTYGEVKSLAPCKSVSMTFEQESEQVFADNAAQIIVNGAGKSTKTFEVMAIDPAVVAELTGQDILTAGDKKIIVTRSGAVAPYVAIGYKLFDTDSDTTPCEYVWCFKGKVKFPDKTSATIDDSTQSNGQTVEVEFVETLHKFNNLNSKDGAVDMAVPHLGTGYDMTKWDAQVVTPDNYETVLKSA